MTPRKQPPFAVRMRLHHRAPFFEPGRKRDLMPRLCMLPSLTPVVHATCLLPCFLLRSMYTLVGLAVHQQKAMHAGLTDGGLPGG